MKALPALLALVTVAACTDSLDERANGPSDLDGCEIAAICGDLVHVDCGAAVDGPAYYFHRRGDFISACGGACNPFSDLEQKQVCATLCPPPAWTCSR